MTEPKMNSELEREAFAAGMLKAAEICHSRAIEVTPESMSEALELGKVEDAIREAIPTDSKAALRERDRELCMKVARKAAGCGWSLGMESAEPKEADLLAIVNSVLEGKS